MTDDKRLAEIRARVEKALPGPWFIYAEPEVNYGPAIHYPTDKFHDDTWSDRDSLELMANCRTDIPFLLAVIERLEAQLTPGSPTERAPTTWAYEAACKALHSKTEQIEHLTAARDAAYTAGEKAMREKCAKVAKQRQQVCAAQADKYDTEYRSDQSWAKSERCAATEANHIATMISNIPLDERE